MSKFDEHAKAYDSWFFDNENLLYSELKLVHHFLDKRSEILSIGCGSGLFEMLLKKEYQVEVKYGIEPSESMANIAKKRGLQVEITSAEEAQIEPNKYDIIMFNGSPSYIKDLTPCFEKAYNSLKNGGKIIVIDVPKESSYATLYNLAASLGTWAHPLLENIAPKDPYPIELVKSAFWRTTDEKVSTLKKCGFTDFQYAQTLLTHPMHSNDSLQEVIEGYDKGDYVAICAYKK